MIIVFEGLPGSGKSTTINNIFMDAPSNISIIPEIALTVNPDFDDFAFYYRNDLYKNKLLNYHQRKKTYLVDRFWQSTIVYKCAESYKNTKQDLTLKLKEIYQEPIDLYDDYYYVYLYTNIENSYRKARTHIVESEWKKQAFLERASKLYHVLFENLEEFVPHLRGKLCF